MSIEERLTRALEEEADQIDVDVVRLLGVTRGRLTTKLDATTPAYGTLDTGSRGSCGDRDRCRRSLLAGR